MRIIREKEKKKGFTILEILVVLSVIAILIGIAVPRFKGMQDAANVTKAKSELRVYQAAVESIKNMTGAYPVTTANLGSVLASASPVITTALVDPFSTTGADYNYIANGSYYVISSVGSAGTGSVTAIHNTTGIVTKTGAPLEATNGTP
ncbi:MAG: prepilin-type N-terminal cleavage/methylation domain-containing protein [Candidatus Omnitrophica bacterium]|nr:prepilin-type N-terminal cleavage/methylation domain-containing protein [Candidatus Omnitrophota bacterium]